MSSNAPPDGWRVLSGTWGVDFNRSETVNVGSGSSIAIDADATAIDKVIVSPWQAMGGSGDNVMRKSIEAWTLLRATANGASDKVKVEYELGNEARTSVGTSIISDQIVAALNTWEIQGLLKLNTTGASRWLRFRYTVLAAATGTHYIGGVAAELCRPFTVSADTSFNTSLVVGTWTKIQLRGASNSEHVMNVDEVQDRVDIYEPGPYAVHAAFPLGTVDDGDFFQGRCVYVDVNSVTSYLYGPPVMISAAVSTLWYLPVNGAIVALADGPIWFEINQYAGTARAVLGQNFDQYISITKAGR